MLTIIISCKFNPSLAPVDKGQQVKIEAFRGGLIEVSLYLLFHWRFISLVYSYEAGAVGAVCLMVITLWRKRWIKQNHAGA